MKTTTDRVRELLKGFRFEQVLASEAAQPTLGKQGRTLKMVTDIRGNMGELISVSNFWYQNHKGHLYTAKNIEEAMKLWENDSF